MVLLFLLKNLYIKYIIKEKGDEIIMDKVNLLININDYNNAKIGDVLVKDEKGIRFISKKDLFAELNTEVDSFNNKIDEVKNAVRNSTDAYKDELVKVLKEHSRLVKAVASTLIEIDIVAGEIDRPETEEEYVDLVNEYIEKVGATNVI